MIQCLRSCFQHHGQRAAPSVNPIMTRQSFCTGHTVTLSTEESLNYGIMEDEGLRRSLWLSSCLLFAQGGVLCHITCKWCGHSAQCWGCCPARRAVRSRKRLNNNGSRSASCISRTIAALLWDWRGAEEHACSAQVKTIRPFNFSAAATFSAPVRNRDPRLCRCCSDSARIPEDTFFFFFSGGNLEKCLARRLPKVKQLPAARLRAARPVKVSGKLRGAARASFRWTVWSIPADPPSATAASFTTSPLR